MPDSFWKIDLGNVLTFGTLMASFWLAHAANIKRIAQIETKVTLLYRWFLREKNINGDD